MQKILDWETKLSRYIEWHRHRPFEYGASDCTTFVLGAIDTQYGTDFTSTVVIWQSREDYLAMIHVAGGAEYAVKDFAEAIGMRQIAPAFAKRGDILVIDTPLGYMASLCVGATAAMMGDKGLLIKSLDTLDIKSAWTMET